MSKRITVQDGNLEFNLITGAISFPSETRDLDFVGESGTIAAFHDGIITTNATTLEITEAGTWDTITRVGGSDFLTEGFFPGQVITISGSGTTNDGVYEIANDGVAPTVITVEWFYDLVDEGPSGTLTLTGSDKYFELSDDSKLKLTSWEDPTLYGTFETTGGGHLQIRMSDPDPLGGSVFTYGGGHIGILDVLNTVSDPPADSDIAEATVGGWSLGDWQLWDIGVIEGADMDLTIGNFVPDSAIDMYVNDVTDTFYRPILVGDYATGTHLYWPTSNSIALSTDAAGIYSPLGSLYLEEKAAAGGDTATRGQLWVRNDNPSTLVFTDGDSTDFVVGGALTSSSLITVADTASTSTFLVMTDNATGNEAPLTDANLTYSAATTGTLTTGTFSGALSGNATTATSLATSRTIGMTGDVAWTSASFDGSGNVTGTSTIQADSVTYAKMQNVVADDVFLGNIAGAGGLVAELTGTQATVLLDAFATASTVQGVVPGSNSLGATYYIDGSGAWSIPSGAGSVTSVGLTAGTLVDISGTNPITTSGTMTIDVDLSEAAEAVYAPATDYLLFLDGGVSGTAAKESGADFATALAGSGITATSGVLSADNVGTVTSVAGGTGVASTGGATPSISLTVDELAEKSGAVVGTDRLVGTTSTTNWAETISGIPLSIFNNDIGGGSGSTTFVINADINTATPPTTENVTAELVFRDLADNDDIAELGFTTVNNNFNIRNMMRGGDLTIIGTNASGGTFTFLDMNTDSVVDINCPTDLRLRVGGSSELAMYADANASVDIYYNAIKRFGTSVSGAATLYSDTSTDGQTRYLSFAHQDGTQRAAIGYTAAGATFYIRSEIHGAPLSITGEDNAGDVRPFLYADPDATTSITGDTDVELWNSAGVDLAVKGFDGARTGIYYDGTEKLRTALHTAADQISGAEVVDAEGNFQPVGVGVVINDSTTFDTVATHTPFQQANATQSIYFVGAGAGTANFDTYANTGGSQTNIPVGTMWYVQNNAATTILVIRGGTSVTIRYWDGSGVAPADADVTVARGGVATVRKVADNIYDVWGIGLS